MTDAQAPELVQYGTLTPNKIGEIGIKAATAMLHHMDGHTSHRPLRAHVRAAMDVNDGVRMTQVAEVAINGGDEFAVNTTLQGGKLATADEHCVDSGLAAMNVGFEAADGDDPRGWPGSKFAEGFVLMPDGTLIVKRFGVATSGIEGPNDKVASAAGAQAMASAWELDIVARHPGARVTVFASA